MKAEIRTQQRVLERLRDEDVRPLGHFGLRDLRTRSTEDARVIMETNCFLCLLSLSLSLFHAF